MRRADRLFRIVTSLRRRKVTTARRLADELEVSERTVYRDIADLIASGVPVTGEAGVGYALGRGFDLPPIMFTEDELEALVAGARIVESWADEELAEAARAALAKVAEVLPQRLVGRVGDTPLYAPDHHVDGRAANQLGPLRRAIRDRKKCRIAYHDAAKTATSRVIRPLGLFFWGKAWTVAAWCEHRSDFRGFRLDRIDSLEVLVEKFPHEPGRNLEDFIRRARAEGPPRE